MNQGEFAQLICVVRKGDEPITLNWSLKGDIISSDPDLSTTMLGRRTSMLTIAVISYRHMGTYTCRATNPAGTVTYSAELRVNGIQKQFRKILEISLFFRATTNCSFLIWSGECE